MKNETMRRADVRTGTKLSRISETDLFLETNFIFESWLSHAIDLDVKKPTSTNLDTMIRLRENQILFDVFSVWWTSTR